MISTVDANASAIAWFILKPVPPTREDLRNLNAQHPELEAPLAPLMEGQNPSISEAESVDEPVSSPEDLHSWPKQSGVDAKVRGRLHRSRV